MTTESAALIAVDWGTSSLRAVLMSAHGTVLDRRHGPEGITRVADKDFAAVLERYCGGWLAASPTLPIIATGMIGSRNGWLEVTHVPCPAGLAALGAGLGTLPFRQTKVHFVAGLSTVDSDGIPDVMRGEEVQIFGALPDGSGTVVLPGTHSKWATVEGGRVTAFRTFMTGELFAAVIEHTIIGQLADGRDPSPEAFLRGVGQSRIDPALSHALFTARTLPLSGRMAQADVSSYLSGVLIGSEFAAHPAIRDIIVIGDDRLTGLYLAAADAFGVAARPGPADAAFIGAFELARSLGLFSGA